MNTERAKEILSQFPNKKILVVGDVVLDQYIKGTVERINPEAPVPILHVHSQTVQTGGAGNTAKNAASLGVQTSLISVVGKDEMADQVSASAQQEGYSAKLITDPSRPTIKKIRYIAASQQMLRVDYEETHAISSDIEQGIIAELKVQAGHVDAIIVSDYNKGVITPTLAKAIQEIAKKKNLPMAADLKPLHAQWFNNVTLISPNLKEGHEILGQDPLDHASDDFAAVAQALRQKLNCKVFLTLSARGIYVASDTTPGQHVPQIHQVEVADTSGAGDTAVVMLLLAVLSGASDVEAAELANAAGAVVVGKLGAVGVNVDEVLAKIQAVAT